MIDQYIEHKQYELNNRMLVELKQLNIPSSFMEAILYSMEAGGKRLRPILMMATYEAFHHEPEKIVHPALALEMIHTYSLIHDDLPAMDDDDFRRGRETIHKKFDEATAILVGDGLLTYAFQVVSTSSFLEAEEKVYTLKQFSQASGFEGMIAGQHLDLKAENKHLNEHELNEIHQLKTGALIRAAIKIGAYLGGATPTQIESLDDFGKYLGLVFQIQDDILDVSGDMAVIGKPVGSDEAKNKSTYPQILGLNEAIRMKESYMNEARNKYEESKIEQPILLELLDIFGNRQS
ncbi:polyprenyl synthetase family protein [Piscibacillus halophilus]|uniref:polyprenyl synthetase family protein n=1 Tax=Piscibacillus halophilus TaxID=571933 RepID=UPI00240A68CC|nr:farnesyl diphosphate synthase [Piscibacillus halophilus]